MVMARQLATMSFTHTSRLRSFVIGVPQFISVGVSEPGVLNRLVNLCCVLLIPDGDAKRHKVYTGSGNGCPTSSLRRCSCIPCTGVLVVGGYKLGQREGVRPRSL